MEITDVRIRKLNANNADDNKLRAIVSVTFDNEFVIHDIKVIQGTEKLFIAMPSRKVEDGTYKDITHPIKSDFRDKLQLAVMARYEKALAGVQPKVDPCPLDVPHTEAVVDVAGVKVEE